MKATYGYSHMAVVEFCNKFRQARESTKDFAHPGPANVAGDSRKLLYAQVVALRLENSNVEHPCGNYSFHHS